MRQRSDAGLVHRLRTTLRAHTRYTDSHHALFFGFCETSAHDRVWRDDGFVGVTVSDSVITVTVRMQDLGTKSKGKEKNTGKPVLTVIALRDGRNTAVSRNSSCVPVRPSPVCVTHVTVCDMMTLCMSARTARRCLYRGWTDTTTNDKRVRSSSSSEVNDKLAPFAIGKS